MKKQYSSIEDIFNNRLNTEEYSETKRLIKELEPVLVRGFFTKDEFMKMALWKSHRPMPHYLKNSDETIIQVSKEVLSTNSEKLRIELLTTRLSGVRIPVASAILTLIDPQNYGVIDTRVWQLLYLYGCVQNNPKGRNFKIEDWLRYLDLIRHYANKFKVRGRDIERTLFKYQKEIQNGNLYS